MRSALVTAAIVAMSLATPADAFLQQQQPMAASRSATHLFSSSPNDGVALAPENQQAFDQKNASREKFGLKPITPIEFMDLQAQVAQMERDLQMKRQQQVRQDDQPSNKSSSPFGSFAKKMLKSTTEDSCFSSFDCESPKVCCDLGFKKMCCSNGMLEVQLEYAMAEVPVDMRG